MSEETRSQRIHELEATVRVGKRGVEAVTDELASQLENSEFVKAKFLRASRGGTDTETLAADLAEAVDGEVVETRGHTAVFER